MESDPHDLTLSIPPELVEAIAVRVAELLAERLEPPADPYLDADAAAEYLAAPRSRVYELVERRRLRPHRDGRRLLFRRADLDAALTQPEGSG
ncbi:MAG: helix-turn-helix domain-containing protein [Actinomycetota bacterium]